jgi:hypothetical protein
MSAKWKIEAFIYNRKIEVHSDGTEQGTSYACSDPQDAQMISGYIHYKKKFPIAHGGPPVNCNYDQLGIMAAIAGIHEGHAIFTKIPKEAKKSLSSYYAGRQTLKKKYGRIAF